MSRKANKTRFIFISRAEVTYLKVRKNNDNVNANDNFFSFYANITRFLIVLRTRNRTNDDENVNDNDSF